MAETNDTGFSALGMASGRPEEYRKATIDAWFWGHEHRCAFCGPHENVRNARLIGHGGVPVHMFHRKNSAYPEPVTY
jgi:hypothetical protein